MNVTTNWNVVVDVLNSLDEPLLLTWDGIQHQKNCWEEEVLGTNCPIPAGWNWTYQFQVKDQIGSFFYFPSLGLQRAAGGYGGINVNNRDVIAVPFGTPDGDITLFIGDYIKNHIDLRKALDASKDLGMPDGVLMNGKGPYQYNKTFIPDGIDFETIHVEPGKTCRFRIHNVGIATSLNFRIQNHNMLLVETKGTYIVQQNYTNLDIHVLPSLKEKHDEFMLRELVKRWSNHKVMGRWLSRFFHYLDRYFLYRKTLPSLNEVVLICFRELVIVSMNLHFRIW